MAQARCVLTMRAGAHRPDACVAYHAHLFGYENVEVIEEGTEPDPSGGALVLACGEYLVSVTEDGLSCRRGRIEAALTADGVEIAGGLIALREPHIFAVESAFGPGLTRLRFGPVPLAGAPRVVFQGLGTMLEALGYEDEWLGSPVRSPRGGADDAVWLGEPLRRFKGPGFAEKARGCAS